MATGADLTECPACRRPVHPRADSCPECGFRAEASEFDALLGSLATAYAGLAPGIRQSAGRTKQLGITKEGSRLLRWAMVQAAWRAVRFTTRWRVLFQRLKQRCGAKKAIVAVARRLWCVLAAMLRSGEAYRYGSA